MTHFVNKNNGKSPFDSKKIFKAISKAMKSGSGVYNQKLAQLIADEAEEKFGKKESVTYAEVDKFVLKKIFEYGQNLTGHAYERYKTAKKYQDIENTIDDDVYGIIDGTNSSVTSENANKDARMISTQRDLIAGTTSRSYAERKIMPTHILAAHNEGLIHYHDSDYAIHRGMFNCCLINLDDMLENGTVINGVMIEKPKSLRTACTIATQISLQIANGQYGGQTMTISSLAPFVRISYNKYLKFFLEKGVSQEKAEELSNDMLKQEIKDACQILQYQEVSFSSSNGQAPFVSLFLYINEKPDYIVETAMLIEEILKQRLYGIKNEYGELITPAFPKLLYVLDENNAHEGSEYWKLTQLAIKCSSVRMNPDYISAKIMRELYEGNVFPCMGCRSFLSPWKDENGNYKFYGRFNRGVVTINLVDAALSAAGDEEKFWHILDERLELVKEALILKDTLLRDSKTTGSPIHWQHGAIARLNNGETINKYLDNGYSTISLGYIGLYEASMALLKESHTTERGREFGLKILQHLNDKANEWKKEDHLHGCSIYGTPSESLCKKFAFKTRDRFGEIKNVTDKDWFTNSYHISVFEPIDAFSKLSFESEFQKLSKGGSVSYVELPDLTKNLDAITEVVKHIYNNNLYAEINLRGGDHCGNCGFKGEIKINNNNQWECPNCGCTDRNKFSIFRRVCGYVNNSCELNSGKMAEMKNRVFHL